MHLNAKPPVLVPPEYRAEIEKLSKAALMDVVWDYAVRTIGREDQPTTVMHELRKTFAIINAHRKHG